MFGELPNPPPEGDTAPPCVCATLSIAPPRPGTPPEAGVSDQRFLLGQATVQREREDDASGRIIPPTEGRSQGGSLLLASLVIRCTELHGP